MGQGGSRRKGGSSAKKTHRRIVHYGADLSCPLRERGNSEKRRKTFTHSNSPSPLPGYAVADFYSFDPASNAWAVVAANGSAPSARCCMGFVAAPTGLLYLFGGGSEPCRAPFRLSKSSSRERPRQVCVVGRCTHPLRDSATR